MMPIIKQIPENKPSCLLSATSSFAKTAPDRSVWTPDATDTGRCSAEDD